MSTEAAQRAHQRSTFGLSLRTLSRITARLQQAALIGLLLGSVGVLLTDPKVMAGMQPPSKYNPLPFYRDMLAQAPLMAVPTLVSGVSFGTLIFLRVDAWVRASAEARAPVGHRRGSCT